MRIFQSNLDFHIKATISVDSCVSDCAEAAQFMQALAGFLENPTQAYLPYSLNQSSVYLPQLAEINTPRPMDVAGECLLYDGFMVGISA